MNIFNRPHIANEIKLGELEWAGHACRKQNAMVQRVLWENPRSKRPLDRLRLRWKDGIKKDFLNTRSENYEDLDWKEAAENKNK